MAYSITFKEGFHDDYDRLDQNDRNKVKRIFKELKINPNQPRGSAIKKLTHYEYLWRYRLGDKRLVYAVFPEREVVQLLGIGPRKDVYDRMNYHPDAPDLKGFSSVAENALNPDKEAPADWGKYARPEEKQQTPLTHLFTTTQLKNWDIPDKYIEVLTSVRTEEQLEDAEIPDHLKLKIIEKMAPPARIEELVQQPNRVLEDAEDLDSLSKGEISLFDFLLLLDQDQEKLVDWSLKGPTLVKGGAGSGKSTIALYRARELCRQAAQQLLPPKILFTTYTNALTNSSEQLFKHLVGKTSSNLTVQTVDKLAYRIVASLDGKPNIATGFEIDSAIETARISLEEPINQQVENPLQKMLIKKQLDNLGNDYLIDEIKWVIDGRGIESLEEYLSVNRSGRGYGFNDNMRKIIWKLYEVFRICLRRKDKQTFAMLRKRALQLVLENKWTEKFDYVLVDEAQDLSPVAIQLCLAVCESPAGLFLTADASQSIYNRGFSWNNVHEDLKVRGRTRILKRNYRSTREIATAVDQILADSDAGDKEVLNQICVHSGLPPEYFEADEEEDMIYWIYQSITTARHKLKMPLSAAAVLSTTNEQAEKLAFKLTMMGLPTAYMPGKDMDLERNAVKSITIHSAKGLEFPIIVIPYLEEGFLPKIDNDKAEDLEEQLAQQRRLLYVGCSRAMRRLYITWRKDQKSSFIQNLSAWNKGILL